MGLFDFLKKKKDSAEEGTEKERSSEIHKNVFRGDLAILDERSGYEDDLYQEDESQYQEDSPESVVFLSFPAQGRSGWRCSECGTLNDENMDGCAVCGQKRK